METRPTTAEQQDTAKEILTRMEMSQREIEQGSAHAQSSIHTSLLSDTTFESLSIPHSIIKSLILMKFERPSKVQADAIPPISKGRDVAFQSHSGTGKTMAFLIGTLMRIDTKIPSPQAIILTPTREISLQIMKNLQELLSHMETPSYTAHLAVSKTMRHSQSPITAHVIIGTPGTVHAMMKKSLLGSSISLIVLDEADILLMDEGLCSQTVPIIKMTQCQQVVLFSATFNEEMRKISASLLRNAESFLLEKEGEKPKNINLFFLQTEEAKKPEVLIKLYEVLPVGQSVIFVSRRDRAEEVKRLLEKDGFETGLLHGGMEPEERDRVIKGFREGGTKVLVSTNVLSRGLDVPQLNLAVNYDIPLDQGGEPDYDTYIHRVGRTGRFNRIGVSIDFVAGRKDMESVKRVGERLKEEIRELSLEALLEERLRSL